jgi:hypothetical protein
MNKAKSLLRVAGVALGVLGVVLCFAALAMLWTASTRLGQFTESVFDRLDKSLVAARQRVIETQDRVEAAKITTQDIETRLRGWTGREVAQRLALRLEAEERTERLETALQQAGVWLDVAE